MNTLLRKLIEWNAGRRGAQLIVYDGGAQVERTRAFMQGTVLGAGLALGAFLLTAPTTTDSLAMQELERREMLLRDANGRMRQALEVADICLTTAARLEKTLADYQSLLGGTPRISN